MVTASEDPELEPQLRALLHASEVFFHLCYGVSYSAKAHRSFLVQTSPMYVPLFPASPCEKLPLLPKQEAKLLRKNLTIWGRNAFHAPSGSRQPRGGSVGSLTDSLGGCCQEHISFRVSGSSFEDGVKDKNHFS